MCVMNRTLQYKFNFEIEIQIMNESVKEHVNEFTLIKL